MRRVLTLAYHFPPFGGAGVQRNAQLARRLGDLGWSQTVIAGPGSGESRWTPVDAKLGAEELPSEILRLPATQPDGRRWAERAERWLRAPSAWRKWWRGEVLRLVPEIRGPFDVIHASLAPYQTAEAAVELADLLDVPLVLDFEDPWALDDMLVYPTALHRSLERARMQRTLERADVVVMNTREAVRRVHAAFPRLAAEVVAIPNSFDGRDFVTVPSEPAPDDAFRIVHTGSFHTDLGLRGRRASRLRRALGGYERNADFLARSPAFLLEAIRSVLATRPELITRLELHLAGVLTPEDEELLGDAPFVHRHGFLTHDHTIALIRTADLLFLPLYDLPVGRRAAIVPQKTYEYVASERPILAAVPDGDARDLLRACGTARLCRPTDVDALATAILDFVGSEGPAATSLQPAHDVVRRCEAGQMTQALTAVFERAASRRRPDARAAVGAVAVSVS